MRVVHIDTEHTWRGGEQQALYTLVGLRDRGISAVALAQPDSAFLERCTEAGLETRAFRVRGEWDLAAARRLAGVLSEETFDIVHAQTPHAHAVALLARWFLPREKRPLLVVSRRVDFPIRPDYVGLRRRKYNRADCIIAISTAVRDVLVAGGVRPEKITLVREGVDIERIDRAPERTAEIRCQWGVPEGAPFIVNVAALTGHKGQRYLIEAAPAIRQAVPEARMVIFGDGDLRSELEERIRLENVADAVTLAGFRPPEEIPSVLKAADVFVFPSVLEGLGTSLFDAMAARAPIVTTTAGGIPDIVQNERNGLLVSPRDPAALARAVVRVVQDAELREKLITAAREFVEREGTYQRMVEETVRVYEGLKRR